VALPVVWGWARPQLPDFWAIGALRPLIPTKLPATWYGPASPPCEKFKTPSARQFWMQLRREELARLVFADVLARQALENILHPRIRSHWQAQIETWRNEGQARALVVIPLLFETKAESYFDKIICAACRPDTQWKRLAARGWNVSHIEQRMAAQMSIEEKITRSHYIVWTEGRMESLARQVDLMLARISGLNPETAT
jgi:dephospho-CoA kinase